jgi:hypothetical protein
MRRTAVIACSALALALAGLIALASATASPRPTPPDSISRKGKLATDGFLTVGQAETVQVRKLPPKVKLHLEITPPLFKGSCANFDVSICISAAPIPPVPGTPPFRTNGKGRATLTFTMPDHYDLLNARNLVDRTPVTFPNEQQVIVTASGIHRERLNGRKELIFAFAQSGAVVQTAQPAPAP